MTGIIEVKPQKEFQITVISDTVAPFVWLDAPGIRGRFSDNGFLMVNPKTTVQFHAWDATDVSSLSQAITVKSLMDVYHV